jgi:hypothetical protein
MLCWQTYSPPTTFWDAPLRLAGFFFKERLGMGSQKSSTRHKRPWYWPNKPVRIILATLQGCWPDKDLASVHLKTLQQWHKLHVLEITRNYLRIFFLRVWFVSFKRSSSIKNILGFSFLFVLFPMYHVYYDFISGWLIYYLLR